MFEGKHPGPPRPDLDAFFANIFMFFTFFYLAGVVLIIPRSKSPPLNPKT